MPGNFRNNLQVAMLYAGHADVVPSLDLEDFRRAMFENGIPLQVTQENPTGVLMMGAHDLQLTCSYHDKPADRAVFSRVLKSPVTHILCPNAQELVDNHRSYVLIEVQQGVFGGVEDDPEIAGFFNKIGFPRAGRDLGSFNRRVDVLAAASRSLHRKKPATALHWTQSNTLVSGDKLDPILTMTDPGLLTIHPMMFGSADMPGYKETPVEIYTIGAADYVGREIHTDFAPIPWLDIHQCITAFVRMATMPNGYIIPDGDTFGIETDEFSWRVTHLDGKTQPTINGQPHYNLKLLYHHGHGYTAPDFERRQLVKGGIPEASSKLDGPEPARREQIAKWEKTQEMAQRAGGQVKIYSIGSPDPTPPDGVAPAVKRFGSPVDRVTPTFGKRKT